MIKIFQRNIKFIILFIGMSLLLSACSSSAPVRTPDRDAQVLTPAMDESFDPVLLEDEDLEFPKTEARVSMNEGSNSNLPIERKPKIDTSKNRIVSGFRVQLFATRDSEIGEQEKQKAAFLFAEDGVAAYIEYDAPMYKVRVGDCQTREDAEKLRTLSIQKDYVSSWIVRSKVNTHPVVMEIEDTGTTTDY